MALTVDPYKT